MAKKRGNNEGSIYKRKNGSWRAQISLDGRRLSFTAQTRHECQEWMKKTIRQIDDGLTFRSITITLEEYLSRWLTHTKASKCPSTWAHYEQLTRNHVCPHLGKVKIKDLRSEHIQTFYNYLLEKGVGTHTVIKIHMMLHSALKLAVRSGLTHRNVTELVMPPKEPYREMKILNESQIGQLLATAYNTRLEALLYLAVTTGMRQMELLGLKWGDLDWSRHTIRVERQLIRHNKEGIQYGQPKTRRGRRTIALGDRSIEVLRYQFEKQIEERKIAGVSWQETELIFTTRNGTPIHYRNLLRDFKNLLQKAGLPMIRFHDLRHTAASLMLKHGIPVLAVSQRLGHSRPSITLDVYGHLIPGMQAEVAQKIEELITPASEHLLIRRS